LKAEKRRYSKNTVTVLNGAIEEYWNFVKYSINDVLLQYGIDEVTNDLDTLFDQSMYGGTRFSKTLKQSVYLKNFWAINYFMMDIVPGNNINVNYVNTSTSELAEDIELYKSIRGDGEDDEDKDYDDMSLPGAVVGDPNLNAAEGIELFGSRSSRMFKLTCDFDYSSMYPNAKITANIASHTQWGRLIIPEKVLPNENPDNNPKFMRAGKFIEDYETGDMAKIGAWFGLPTKEMMIKEWKKRHHDRIKYSIEMVDGFARIKARRKENDLSA